MNWRRCRTWAVPGAGVPFVLVLALLPGCKTPGSFREPVARFKEANTSASVALGKYYAELNRFERDLYLDERLYDVGLEVLASDAAGQPTPLLGKLFSPESIQARMDAIALLGTYAERLATLAGSEDAGKLPEGAQALGAQLGTLGLQLEKLSGKGDSTAGRYVAPVTTLVGVVTSLYLENKQGQVLQEGIQRGAPQVTALLDLLEADLVEVLGPQRLTGAKQAVASRVMYYNLQRGTLSLAERRAVIEDIRQSATVYEALVVANPVELARALRDAHEALLRFARSDRQLQSFEELSSAMQAFKGRVDIASAAVQAIRTPVKE
ncbi:hypothetical protein [Melittangium boletus]|uniref:Uncharacterized protein n=1 Tax=Melittangium boletus DSM 14713 TaxID=1294270 RepID=A0A250IBS7_9BACT|nr:hypothetical protein [Melittangium boletus]ATB29314.1 hypothetical protein MEBOL_002763 [Melittangium boletus DSM 14713]